jgi:putative endonuclease
MKNELTIVNSVNIELSKWVVYILKCSDNTLYTGITNNLVRRIEQHNKKVGAKYTSGRTPVSLLKSFEVENKSEALKLEYKIKQLSPKEKLNFNV